MSKPAIKTDQLALPLGKKIRRLLDIGDRIEGAIRRSAWRSRSSRDIVEDRYLIAKIIKDSVESSGLSRLEFCDRINTLYGWPTEADLGGKTRKRGNGVSPYMFDHYQSKPLKYPAPAWILLAVQEVSRDIEAARVLADDMGGEAIAADEIADLEMGRIQRLKRETREAEQKLIKRAGRR